VGTGFPKSIRATQGLLRLRFGAKRTRVANRSMVVFHVLQVLAILLVAIAMALALAHALELPGKLRLAKEIYLAIQTIYYPPNVAQPNGGRITIDQVQRSNGPTQCFPAGCMADHLGDAELVAQLKQGQVLSIEGVDSAGRPISVTLPLAGFARPTMDRQARPRCSRYSKGKFSRRYRYAGRGNAQMSLARESSRRSRRPSANRELQDTIGTGRFCTFRPSTASMVISRR